MIWRREKNSVIPAPLQGLVFRLILAGYVLLRSPHLDPLKKLLHPILGLGQYIVNNQAMASVLVYPVHVVCIVSNDALFEFGIFNLCR